MTEYLTEQEQVELLKNWIKQYSLVIIAGVLLAVAVISGWRYWQQRQQNILSHASTIYDEMLSVRAQNDTTATKVQADKIVEHYPNTTYGQMADLMMARTAVIKQDFPEAEKQLHSVMDHSKVHSIRQIARIRLARIQIAAGKPETALDTLKKMEDKSFAGLIDEVRGDAFLALNDPKNARQAYQQALDELPNAEVIRPVLRMKYDNLAVSPSS